MFKDRLMDMAKANLSHFKSIDEEVIELIPKYSQEFSTLAAQLVGELESIREALNTWQSCQQSVISGPRVEKEQKEALELLRDRVRASIARIQPAVDDLAERFEVLQQADLSDAGMIMTTNQHTLIQTTLREAKEDLNAIEVEYQLNVANWFEDDLLRPSKNDIQTIPLVMSATTTTTTTTVVEVETVDETVPKLQRQQTLNKAYKEMQQRNVDILEVEGKTKMLAEMMDDMNLLVNTQVEMCDRVDQHVDATNYLIGKSEKDVKQAERRRNATNDKLCIIYAIIFCVAVVFILVGLPKALLFW
ncbi:unnamed protein product, partial [Mesorhabditis spiculigera]